MTAVPMAPPPSPLRKPRREMPLPFFASSMVGNLLFVTCFRWGETAKG
jgi:hypothetical protein